MSKIIANQKLCWAMIEVVSYLLKKNKRRELPPELLVSCKFKNKVWGTRSCIAVKYTHHPERICNKSLSIKEWGERSKVTWANKMGFPWWHGFASGVHLPPTHPTHSTSLHQWWIVVCSQSVFVFTFNQLTNPDSQDISIFKYS